MKAKKIHYEFVMMLFFNELAEVEVAKFFRKIVSGTHLDTNLGLDSEISRHRGGLPKSSNNLLSGQSQQ